MSQKFRSSLALGVMLALFPTFIPSGYAAGSMTLLLVPHCTEQSACPEFAVLDAERFTTGKLAAGDILDIDVLVRGTDFAKVRSVRSWISYDTKVLEARSVELTPALPSPTPGEQNIEKSLGLVKIGGSSTNGFTSSDTRVARVTFRVLETTSDTELSFHGYNDAGNGQTAVNTDRNSTSGLDKGALPPPPCFDNILGCRGTPTPLLSGQPAKLRVQLSSGLQGSILTAQAAEVSSSSSSISSSNSSNIVDWEVQQTGGGVANMSSSAAMTSSSVSSLSGQGSTFGILQVQDVRVTTKDNLIFLGWQALKSAELAGYNVYYGTVSGRYLQRRSVPATATSLVLRDLEPGTTYYLAVRAVNGQNQESVFSQEVSVTVGKPETATSPMTKLPADSGAITGNPIETRGGTTIKGETGSASVFAWILAGSALIGTVFAFRRQLILPS